MSEKLRISPDLHDVIAAQLPVRRVKHGPVNSLYGLPVVVDPTITGWRIEQKVDPSLRVSASEIKAKHQIVDHFMKNMTKELDEALANAIIYGTGATMTSTTRAPEAPPLTIKDVAAAMDALQPRHRTLSPATRHTPSGKPFDILNPRTEDVDINDVAHQLARINRWNGAIKFDHFTVAQHSVIASYAARLIAPECELHALLHDAPEYVIGDINSPMKKAIALAGGQGVIERIEGPIWECVWRALGHGATLNWDIVHVLDIWTAWRESQDVLENVVGPHWHGAFDAMKKLTEIQREELLWQLGPITSGWEPQHAAAVFIDTYEAALERHRKMQAITWLTEYGPSHIGPGAEKVKFAGYDPRGVWIDEAASLKLAVFEEWKS